MGWASGSGLAEDVWDIVRPYVPKGDRTEVALKIFRLFESRDADDWCFEPRSLLWDAGACEECRMLDCYGECEE